MAHNEHLHRVKETYDESRFHSACAAELTRSVVPVERRLQIEMHLEQYQAVIQEHLHGHRHVSEHVWMSSTRRTRRLCWSTEKCTYRVYCRRSRHDGAATRSRKGVGVYSTLTSCSPPVSSTITTTTTTKSWRSDTLIILPGWEYHTGGSRSKPTVHRCSQSGRRLWVARQVHNHEPNGSAAVRQYQHFFSWFFCTNPLPSPRSFSNHWRLPNIFDCHSLSSSDCPNSCEPLQLFFSSSCLDFLDPEFLHRSISVLSTQVLHGSECFSSFCPSFCSSSCRISSPRNSKFFAAPQIQCFLLLLQQIFALLSSSDWPGTIPNSVPFEPIFSNS